MRTEQKRIKIKITREGETYPLHPETTAAVHHLEEVLIGLAAEKVEASNFKVGPEMTHVVLFALHALRVDLLGALGLVAGNLLGQVVLLLRLVGLGLDEHLPQALRGQVVEALVGRRIAEDVRDGLAELFHGDSEAICLVVLDHGKERVTVQALLVNGKPGGTPPLRHVLGDVTEVADLGLQTPVPLVLLEKLVLVKETVGEISARVHVAHWQGAKHTQSRSGT